MNSKFVVIATLTAFALFQARGAYVGIHRAAAQGDLVGLKKYLADDPQSISSRNGPRRTPLCIAAMLYSAAVTLHPAVAFAASEFPREVRMNEDAGHGNWLFVTIALESGEELPFFVDTGTTVTCFDKSLEPKLGKPLGIGKLQHYGNTGDVGIYVAPKLYLDGVRLMTGSNVIAVDFREGSLNAGRPVMGVLGQDCLQHYCIQLDFQARIIRFLDPGHVNPAQFGQALPLTLTGKRGDIRPVVHSASFLAAKSLNLIVDTGNAHDGDFETKLFRREVKKHTLQIETAGVDNQPPNRARLPNCTWNGNNYTNLLIGSGVNSIGLRFLARHLLTLNFPKRTMYLKWITSDPLADKTRDAEW